MNANWVLGEKSRMDNDLSVWHVCKIGLSAVGLLEKDIIDGFSVWNEGKIGFCEVGSIDNK